MEGDGSGRLTLDTALALGTAPRLRSEANAVVPTSAALAGGEISPEHRRSRGRALILFAGQLPCGKGSLAEHLRGLDFEADHVDLLGGVDLSVRATQESFLLAISDGEYSFLFLSPPCSSFCIALEPNLRNLREPYGRQSVARDWGAYLDKHNAFFVFVARAARAAHDAHVPWLFEQPASRSAGPARWPEFANRASAWELPVISELRESTGAAMSLLAQCQYGSEFQKFTSFMGSAECALAMQTELSSTCICVGAHAKIARGYDEFGESRSAASAAYPSALAAAIARVAAAACPVVADSPTGPPQPPSRLRADAAPFTPRTNGVVSIGPSIHLGSSRPHVADGASYGVLSDQWAHGGSLRQLEPELRELLAVEPLPATNLTVSTNPEEPPPRVAHSEPLTDEQLLPPGIKEEVEQYGRSVQEVIKMALRGGNGWRVAKGKRPAAVTYTEAEALNPVGRGRRWQRKADGLWHVLQPSSFPDDPPSSDLKPEAFEALALREGLVDEQLVSWVKHGMPGAPAMKIFAQLAPPHVGALENAEIFVEKRKADEEAGFVSGGFSFPDVWPSVIDPMNIVVQHGKGRLTVDKTMRISEAFESFNVSMDLSVDEAGKRYLLVRFWQFARAAAILDTACLGLLGVQVKVAKLDWEAFFRKNPKQRAYVYQSGRLLDDGFGTDWRVNFGEANAPDHTGRASNAVVFFIRRELARLEAAYPSKNPQLRAWLRYRLEVLEAKGAPVEEFCGAMLFFIMAYVDDLGFAIVDDPLFDHHGAPVLITVYDASGTASLVHQTRAELYFDAAIGISELIGHTAPLKKQQRPSRGMTLIGHGIDLDAWIRFLDADKASKYRQHVEGILNAPPLAAGGRHVEYKSAESLAHRLVHAAEVVPMGRAYYFYIFQSLRSKNHLRSKREKVIFGPKAVYELQWWLHILEAPRLRAVPLASRFSFPNADAEDGVLIHYGDASREFDESSGRAAESSGWGAWTVIDETFFFIEGRWSHDECRRFSINILESAVQNFGAFTFYEKAAELGFVTKHIHTFCDNSSAEMVSERGRTQTPGMHHLNTHRRLWLDSHGVFQKTSRVASEDNDIADLLSRGDVDEALRMAAASGVRAIERLEVSPRLRTLIEVPATWATKPPHSDSA